MRCARNSRDIQVTTHNHVARKIPNQTSQQTLDVDFVTSGGCVDVSGQLTNCVLQCEDDPTSATHQGTVCDVVVQIRQDSVIVIRFLETVCVGALEFPKTKVFAQLCHTTTRLQTCGEVEDVAGALTPVCRGVAQVFQDLLVELRLLLASEVEEGEEEKGQEEVWEAESGEDQREERTLTWMAMQMGEVKVRTRLNHEPKCV